MRCGMSLDFRKFPLHVHSHIHAHKHTYTQSQFTHPSYPSMQRIHDLVLESIILGEHHSASTTTSFSAAQLGSTKPHWKVKG